MLDIQRKISAYNFFSGNNIQFIVVHDVGTKSTAKNNADYFSGGNRGASAHLFVDDVECWQSVEFWNGAWHVGDGNGVYGITNTNSIGVEMCLPSGKVTDKTEQNTVEIVRFLMKKYNIPISRVVRHYDASRKNCPAQFNLDGNWTRWNNFKKKLEDKATAPNPAPKPNNSLPKGFTAEKGTFINGSEPIQVRVGNYGLNAPKGGMLPARERINYDGWINDGTYTWVVYTGYSGDKLFLPVRHNGTPWGDFK